MTTMSILAVLAVVLCRPSALAVVLSGGSGPGPNGQWIMNFANGYGNMDGVVSRRIASKC